MIRATMARHRSLVCMVAAVLAVTMHTGCTSDGPAQTGGSPAPGQNVRSGGPMDFGGDRGRVCNPRLSHDITYGEAVRNPGPGDLTVTAISLVGAEGLELADAYFALIKPWPDGRTNLVGFAMQWPPPGEYLTGARITMKDLKPATDAALAPTAGVDRWNLILHLRRPDLTKPAKYASVRIDYQVGGKAYFKTSTDQLILTDPCPS